MTLLCCPDLPGQELERALVLMPAIRTQAFGRESQLFAHWMALALALSKRKPRTAQRSESPEAELRSGTAEIRFATQHRIVTHCCEMSSSRPKYVRVGSYCANVTRPVRTFSNTMPPKIAASRLSSVPIKKYSAKRSDLPSSGSCTETYKLSYLYVFVQISNIVRKRTTAT